ncbi:hypothetical protein FEM48_Zijuj04G0061200 [Ziziphus jujuba var. spinosa]|uniref:GDSL esterase/lipase 7-like n=1 Tax=Ziziphus jujuba var. spinosa TaxID=714518 RepID=A0A978VI87_ZIZJJ|nr:hypothetical protein FEM48_Zijuj04G0061200 [Ziziphus jujuba var. spinosa]
MFVTLVKISVAVGNLPLAPALYVFGDSLFDNGNNNLLPTVAKADFLPYGVNFATGVTGRFTNGRTVADFIAESLGLPYPPPYMSVRLSTGHAGFNYASGSCGIFPQTGSRYGKCLNLEEQIDLFERTVEPDLLARRLRNSNGLSKYFLSKSIFIFAIGSNDFLNNYLNRPNTFASTTRNNGDPAAQSFAQNLVDSLAHQLERLYRLGARKVIMFEIGPIGCIPSIIKKSNNEKGKCVEEINELASYFNQRLRLMLKNLTSSLQGSTFVLGQANWLGYDAINNPSRYGIDSSNPCCTTWTSSCIPWLMPCSEASSHYFWDAYHMTEAVCSVIANRCFNDSSVCSPSIYQLLQF